MPNPENHPPFHSGERMVKLVRGRECFVGLSILLVYAHLLTNPRPVLGRHGGQVDKLGAESARYSAVVRVGADYQPVDQMTAKGVNNRRLHLSGDKNKCRI